MKELEMQMSKAEASANTKTPANKPDEQTLYVNARKPGNVHRVSKNVPPLACYNFDAREGILIFFGRNVTDKVGNQRTLYYATSNNLCFCTTCQNGKT